ncbi:MAG: hypothetical protein JW932_11795 [Deltaproteobacteria bacterium]|nr:hypothetical protein [Deltaproteobacteria bacterium]
MESKIVYFEDIGSQNTEITFQAVKERLNDSGIQRIVMASTTGATARLAMDFFKDSGTRLIVIPHQYDFRKDVNPFPWELVKEMRDAGHEVHFGTMLFHTDQLYESNIPTLMANLLRCFCQGVKVCFEIVMMATDAGLLSKGEKIIAIAGTGRGADTALVMQASSSRNMKRLRVNEIICKPLYPLNIDELLSKAPPEK